MISSKYAFLPLSHVRIGVAGLLFVSSTIVNAANIWVATNGNDTSGSGTSSSPYATIQKGIQAASNGDQVIVKNGVYSGAGNRVISFQGKAIRVCSQNGPAFTTIDCGQQQAFRATSGESTTTELDGFKIINGSVSSSADWEGDGIIRIYHDGGTESALTIRNCIFTGHTVTANYVTTTVGIIMKSMSTKPAVVENCLFYGNTINGGGWVGSSGGGGGVICFPAQNHGAYNITNCTIANNTLTGSGKRIPVEIVSGSIKNCITWGNSAPNYPFSVANNQASMVNWASQVTYSLASGGVMLGGGLGVITLDPLFSNPGAGNYTLAAGSPAANTGDPASQKNLDGSRADMGFRSNLAVGLAGLGPQIDTPPQSLTQTVSLAASFAVTASGTGTLTYQWRKDGTAIPQATSASLNLGAVNKTHEGSYDVVITDDNGSETSQAATLTVISPAIFTSPTSRSSYAGLSTTFSVVAAGTGSVSYQWRKNGVNLPNATSSTLNLSPLKYGHAGDYDVVVTDEFDTATSETATLTVLSPAPNVSISPGDTTVNPGAGHSFTATISTGLPPYTYQWRRNGTPLAKATSAALVLTNIQAAQAGVYDVVVKNAYGVDVSNAVRLSLPPQVPVTQSPVSVDVDPAGTASFTVNVPGATAWQWLKNGTPIKGATSSTLNVPNADASAAGLFSVTVTTPNGKVTTAAAQLRVNDAGLLIYKLTGTGKAYENTTSTNAALSGFLVLDRSGQRGGMIIGSKRGSQNIHHLEVHEDLETRSTGPVPKSQTVVSELVAGEFALWMDGTDGLLTVSKTDKAIGPATLKGIANSISTGDGVRIEAVNLSLAFDAAHSATARRDLETVEQAMARISQDMQAKGSALIESEDR